MTAPAIALGPEGQMAWLADAIEAGGGRMTALEDASALVWGAPDDPRGLAAALEANPGLDWVALPWAGIEPYLEVLDDRRVWTNAKGVYAEPVAEHALTLALAGLRGLTRYVPARTWESEEGRNLLGGRVTIVGGGAITRSLLRLLEPFGAEVTVVRRRAEPIDGAARVVTADRLVDALPGADVVVLTLAMVPDTVGLIGAAELDAMESHAWLVNVARGGHVRTDDLVAALGRGSIGGAALDVTDPEPLPDGHPLWSEPRCIITPHVGNTREMGRPLLAARVRENVERYGRGEPLVGVVEIELGY